LFVLPVLFLCSFRARFVARSDVTVRGCPWVWRRGPRRGELASGLRVAANGRGQLEALERGPVFIDSGSPALPSVGEPLDHQELDDVSEDRTGGPTNREVELAQQPAPTETVHQLVEGLGFALNLEVGGGILV